MPIEINSLFSGIYNSFYSTVGLNRIFSSTFNTALLLSITIILIIVILYPCQKNTPFYLLFKLFLYIAGVTLITFAMHSNFIKNDYKEKYLKSSHEDLITNLHGGAEQYSEEKIDIKPDVDVQQMNTTQIPAESNINEPLSSIIDRLDRSV